MLLLNIVYINCFHWKPWVYMWTKSHKEFSYSDLYFLSLRGKKVSSVYSTVAMLSVNTERWLLDFSIAEISDAIKCHWITKSDRGHDWDKQKVPSQSKTNKTQKINQFCHSQFILTNL